MMAVDASLLAYAVNRYAPEHARASGLVEELANGDLPWAVAWPSLHAFVAIVTHPHAVARPLRPADAWGFVESLLASPSVRALGPTDRHAAVVRELLAGFPPGAPGDDALALLETAAVLREHGVRELLGTDRRLRRFGFLDARDPLRGEP
jgi:predicted nucleic acid-binding protein